jgi:hypothetical protein
MAVDFNARPSYLATKERFRLPSESHDVSIFLVSDSFEYDLEMIKNFPQPKINYKKILIPYRFVDTLCGKPIRYILSQNDYNKKISYLNAQKIQPPIIPVQSPYPAKISDNIYIPFTELLKKINQNLKYASPQIIQDTIYRIMSIITAKHNFSKKKVLWINTRRYPIYKNPSMETFRTDLINALMATYALNPPNKLKRMDLTIIFQTGDGDYKFDLKTFEERDRTRFRQMLSQFGINHTSTSTPSPNANVANEIESLDEIEADAEEAEKTSKLEDSLDNSLEETPEKPKDDGTAIAQMDEDLMRLQATHQSVTKSIKATIDTLMDQLGGDRLEQQPQLDPTKRNQQQMYTAKAFGVNADLLSQINPSQQVDQAKVQKLSDDLMSKIDNPVEQQLVGQAAKKIANETQPADDASVLQSTSSPREEKLRMQMGQLKLNNVTFDKLTSVSDVPKPAAFKPLKTTSTSISAKQGTSFANISKEYEDKLMDRDIVATLMGLSKPSDGFYVTNVEISDISNVTSLMNNWRITLKSKVSNLQNVINIYVPKMFNGRFYVNGTWYNIDKQDFPLPVLKINHKTIIITSNYNKITVERYDTRSLVDVIALRKVMEKQANPDGSLKYIKPGSNVNANNHYISTVEYDEFAKMWFSVTVPESDFDVCFNRTECLKRWKFATVSDHEFCCGMFKQVPIIIDTDTGLTKQGLTLTQTIVSALPQLLQDEFFKMKPGKTSMYATMKIGNLVPVGVGLAAWEGISSLLKTSGVEFKFVEPRFKDSNYLIHHFKDKTLAIRNSIFSQLVFNGFYRINTRGYNFADFDMPIMEANSIYVDIFNQFFFSQHSQLTTFITYYNFFMDAITADVCNHYNIPNTLPTVLLYAINLLCDNTYKNEFDASLYRVRSSEIIPAMIHYHLAVEMSKYNNRTGSKSRKAKFQFTPNCIIQELINLESVKQMSGLNPMIELHSRETISTKGFRGVNNDRAYSKARRAFNDSMIGKIAMSTPNSGTCGISRQLAADPKTESVRGYTSPTSFKDADFSDLQLASFTELLTPGTVSRDDAIRVAIGCSQTGHIVATDFSQPVLIANGVDEIVPSYLTEEFSAMAQDDGKVLEITDGYMIVQYKNGEKQAINVDNKLGFNAGSGFYVNNKLIPNFKAGDVFKKDDILAYHEKFFSKDSVGQVRMNIGPLAKVAFAGNYFTYEDSGAITAKMSKKMSSHIIMQQQVKLDATDDIDKIVKVGDEVEIGDPLVIFGLGDTGDKSVDAFLKAFGSTADDDSFKRSISADHAGKIVDVKIYTNKSLDKLSPSLFKIITDYFKANRQKRKILDKYDNTSSVYKLGTFYSNPTEPLKTPSIKGINTDVLIEIYIGHDDEVSVGDKIADYGACKQIISEVIPDGQEPYSEFRPDEDVDIFQAPSSILKRMVPSLVVNAAGNKCLLELKRFCKQVWEGE